MLQKDQAIDVTHQVTKCVTYQVAKLKQAKHETMLYFNKSVNITSV